MDFMKPTCRLTINIPAHASERNLGHTLSQYARQAGLSDIYFEIAVLVNSTEKKEDLRKSPAFKDAIAARNSVPFPVNVYTKHYQKEASQIGRIRRDLASTTLLRALEGEHPDIGNMILMTNDADLVGIPPEYIRHYLQAFESDESLAGATGAVDLPYDDFYADHVLLSVQRFNQFVETMRRHKLPGNPMIMRGGNSAFRIRDYIRSGGHNKTRISENRRMYEAIGRDPALTSKMLPRRSAFITTNARRQLMALASGQTISTQYMRFGLPGDLAEQYRKPPQTIDLPRFSPPVSASEFPELLQNELNAGYQKYQAIHESESLQQVRVFMRRAASFLGIKIDFNDDDVLLVTNITALRENIIDKYSNF